MTIRKIIREYLENIINEKTEDLDMSGLEEFKFVNNKMDDKENSIWKYSIREENYIVNLFIVKTKNNKWFYKFFVYWGALSKRLTNGKGKDFELKLGPFESFDDLKKSLYNSAKHNILYAFQNYHDNNKTQLNDEVFKLLNDLKKHKENIEISDNKYFKDLKDLLPELLKSKEEVIRFLEKEYPDEQDKQLLILILQKMYKVNLHKQIDSIKSLF